MTVSEPAARSRWRRKLSCRRSAVRQQDPDDRVSWLVPVLGLVVLVLVAGGALWATLDWLERVAAVKADPNAAIGSKDFVVAKLDAVKIALSIIASGGALFALYLAVRRQITAERDLRARLDAQAHTEDDVVLLLVLPLQEPSPSSGPTSRHQPHDPQHPVTLAFNDGPVRSDSGVRAVPIEFTVAYAEEEREDLPVGEDQFGVLTTKIHLACTTFRDLEPGWLIGRFSWHGEARDSPGHRWLGR